MNEHGPNGRITEDSRGRKAHTLPTTLDAGQLLATAGRRGVLVIRWTGERHVAYVDGVEVPRVVTMGTLTTGRVFLKVSGCDDHNSIALDNLTGNELGLLTELCAALVAAQDGTGCRPAATLSTTDPDVDERDPQDWGGEIEPPARPLHVVTGTADPVDEPSGIPEPCRSTIRKTGVSCRLDEGHDGNHRYYAHTSDDPWAPAEGGR